MSNVELGKDQRGSLYLKTKQVTRQYATIFACLLHERTYINSNFDATSSYKAISTDWVPMVGSSSNLR